MIRIFLPLLFLLYTTMCYGASQEKDPPRKFYTPTQYLKNYGLSACLVDGFKSQEAKSDADDAAAAYLELGSFGIEAYQEAAALGRKYLTKRFIAKDNEKLVLMRCINFFHSDELDQLAKKYARKK